MSHSYNYDTEPCISAHEVLQLVGDKWSVLTVINLKDKILRFNELKRLIGSISQRMLSRTLRRLEQDGLVHRTVYPTVPAKVEYGLTSLGESLLTPILELAKWAEENRNQIQAARLSFSDMEHTET